MTWLLIGLAVGGCVYLVATRKPRSHLISFSSIAAIMLGGREAIRQVPDDWVGVTTVAVVAAFGLWVWFNPRGGLRSRPRHHT